jgi:carboxypeptidase C (cathepsin A)
MYRALLIAQLSLLLPMAALADDAVQPRSAVTEHVVHISGKKIPYTAHVAEIPVDGPDGKPAAMVVTIAYERSDVSDKDSRPVIFAFNGGPGASSSPLHMSAMGPALRADSPAMNSNAAGFTDNTASVFDTADLVFIDPVSTGFSRPLPGKDPQAFYSTEGDALEVASVIYQWLRDNHRERSPRYLMGESYGTERAALMLKYAPTLTFDGVLLVSGGGAPEGPNMQSVNLVPGMTAAAWYFNKIDRKGRSLDDIYDESETFARGEYLDALNKGKDMSDAERHKVAQDLAGFIGLPADLIEQKNLRPSKNDFMFNLLKDQGLRTGLLDTRVTAPFNPNAVGDIDDPALGVVKPGSSKDKKPTAASVGPIESKVLETYLTQNLKFPSTDPYYAVNFTANSKWTFGKDDHDTASMVSAAMKTDPNLRLFTVSGYFDLYATKGAGFVAAGVPKDRYTAMMLPGPHSVYDGAEGQNRKIFNDAVRAFVEAGPSAHN